MGWIKVRSITWPIVKALAPLSALFVLNTILGLTALSGENVPMFSALRHLGTLIVLPLETFILDRVPSYEALFAVFLIAVGTLVAAFHDLTFDLHAYVVVGIADVVTAMYLILIKLMSGRGVLGQLSAFDLLYINTVMALPTLLVLFWMSDEWKAFDSPVWNDVVFVSTLLLSLFLAVGTELGVYFNTSVNSPMTQNVVGVSKNSIASVIGMFLNEYLFAWGNFVGLLINAAGSLYYSALKVQNKELMREPRKHQDKEEQQASAEKNQIRFRVGS